jgi:hypothetical protein
MSLYRLTKNSVSKIRQAEGIKNLEAQGYTLEGECNQDGILLPVAKPKAKERKDVPECSSISEA